MLQNYHFFFNYAKKPANICKNAKNIVLLQSVLRH